MEDAQTGTEKTELTQSLEENIKIFESVFLGDETIIMRRIQNRRVGSLDFCLIYADGMTDSQMIGTQVIRPLTDYDFLPRCGRLLDTVSNCVITTGDIETTRDLNQAFESLTYGDCVLLAEGESELLLLNAKGWKTRSITEPENEKSLRGPREGFVESITTNLSMLRRRLRLPDLKLSFLKLGTRTKTKACICYLDSLVNKNVLDELRRRLNAISIDGVLDANYVAELITDAPYSPIRTVGSSEKPDVIAAKLLEGRVALFVDGTPMVLTCPYLFIENFQSDDDYYLNYYFASIGRILRVLALFVSSSTPAIYVALTTFHQEALPTELLLSIASARQGVPFPTVIEAVLMLVVFEILREAGTRMPQAIGQTLSIVGALVIGQAAVDAKIISAPMIIVTAITGITGYLVFKLKGFIILFRFVLLAIVSLLGLYGYVFAMLGFLTHLYNLNSFGVPIVSGTGSGKMQRNKDILVRAPWWYMIKRPQGLTDNQVRQSGTGQQK